MINPRLQLQADLYIHAAREAVFHKFTRLHEWPAWQPGVTAVQWQQGNSWQEDAQFMVDNSDGPGVCYVIRMVSPGIATVWESTGPALNLVYTLHCTDQVGGCKVTLSCTYYGMAVVTRWLRRGQYQRQLQATLNALKLSFQ
ncbi:MAG: SRPBCC family protein [Caldilineaceae bacterium]